MPALHPTGTSTVGTHMVDPRFGNVRIRDRGRLPHWETEAGTYFVTFRLGDALPQPVVKAFEFERKDILQTAARQGRELSATERKRLAELFSERVETYLDLGEGGCHLSRSEIADLVADALRHFDGERYHLLAWCVMPNHAHVVFKALPGQSLERILHSWKSFTAKKANKILGIIGEFWQREYYDHLIRGDEELNQIIHYVADNPRKANLKNWRWVWVQRLSR